MWLPSMARAYSDTLCVVEYLATYPKIACWSGSLLMNHSSEFLVLVVRRLVYWSVSMRGW